MDVVGCAIDRSDVPGWRCIRLRAAMRVILFAEKSVLGKALAEVFKDRALRRKVSVGNQIETCLLAHLKTGPPLFQHHGGAACGYASGVEIVGQVVVRFHSHIPRFEPVLIPAILTRSVSEALPR